MPTAITVENSFRRRDALFLVGTTAIIPVGFYMLNGVSKVLDDYEELLGDVEVRPNMPAVEDITTSLCVALGICAARKLVNRPFQELGKKLLSVKKRGDAERLERFGSVLFKLIYFILITSIGFLSLRQEDWWPTVLGGSGKTMNAYTDMPLQSQTEAVKLYYLVQLGYHMHSLIYMIVLAPYRNDFLEMFLHHCCTVVLIVCSYVTNYLRVGCLVLFVHDASDLFGYAVKASVDTSNTVLTLTLYLSLLVSWFYLRLFVFPVYIIYCTWVESFTGIPLEHHAIRYGLNPLLVCLQALHIYWYGLFLIMGYSYVKTGKTEDIQDAKRAEKKED